MCSSEHHGRWFVGSVVLGVGMWFTAAALPGLRPPHVTAWWLAGFGFIGVELVAQLALQLSRSSEFLRRAGLTRDARVRSRVCSPRRPNRELPRGD